MKKPLLITLLLFSCLIYGQDYHPLVDSLKKWSGMNCSIDPNYTWGPFDCQTSLIKFSGDTIINSLSYLKVFKSDTLQQNWELQGYIRENSGKEIYFRNLIGLEGLMYDFSIGLNDTVAIENTYSGGWPGILVCNTIDSLLIGNEYRKRFYLFDNNTPIDTWIEGIGSEYGVLKSSGFVVGGTYDLLCYYENDSLIYTAPYNDCNISGILGPFFISENIDTAYLNTYYEFQLEITNTTSNAVSFNSYVLPDGLTLNPQTGLISSIPEYLCNYNLAFGLQNYTHTTDVLSTPIVVVNPVSINDNTMAGGLKTYPNPTTDKLQLSGLAVIRASSKFQVNGTNLIRVYSSQGIKVEEFEISNNINTLTIDVSSYKSGLYYMLILNSDEVVKTCKFIKN